MVKKVTKNSISNWNLNPILQCSSDKNCHIVSMSKLQKNYTLNQVPANTDISKYRSSEINEECQFLFALSFLVLKST